MFQNALQKIRVWYRALPDKKKYVEFITALLTVPVLMTVLISNISNINNNKRNEANITPTISPSSPTEIIIVTEKSGSNEATSSPTFTPSPTAPKECKKEVGPVRIATPNEGQLVSSNPVCIQVSYQADDYCSVVWSYRINSGDWSDYSDKEICVHNLAPGPQQLDLRVKSSSSDDEITLVRNFYYKTKDAPTPTTPAATVSPTGP